MFCGQSKHIDIQFHKI